MLFRSSLESVVVDELVGKEHDVVVHAILEGEVDERVVVCFGEALEEADVETASSCGWVADLREGVSFRQREKKG